MNEGSRKLAIMRGVGFGCRDVGTPVLFFSVYIDDSTAALQMIFPPKALDIIKAYGVNDVHDLEGKPCWVDVDDNTIRFSGPWKE